MAADLEGMGDAMTWKRTVYVLGAVIGTLAAGVMGETQPAYIVQVNGHRPDKETRLQTFPIYTGSGVPRRVEVVTRAVSEPASVIDRSLSEQPVHPHLIELNYVNATVYLDPEKNYERPGRFYRIDHNLIMFKVLRL